MRGKAAKRLRRIARAASGGDPEKFQEYYRIAKEAWGVAKKTGAIALAGKQAEAEEQRMLHQGTRL